MGPAASCRPGNGLRAPRAPGGGRARRAGPIQQGGGSLPQAGGRAVLAGRRNRGQSPGALLRGPPDDGGSGAHQLDRARRPPRDRPRLVGRCAGLARRPRQRGRVWGALVRDGVDSRLPPLDRGRPFRRNRLLGPLLPRRGSRLRPGAGLVRRVSVLGARGADRRAPRWFATPRGGPWWEARRAAAAAAGQSWRGLVFAAILLIALLLVGRARDPVRVGGALALAFLAIQAHEGSHVFASGAPPAPRRRSPAAAIPAGASLGRAADPLPAVSIRFGLRPGSPRSGGGHEHPGPGAGEPAALLLTRPVGGAVGPGDRCPGPDVLGRGAAAPENG